MSSSRVASTWDIHIGFLPPQRWDELADHDARARQSLGGHSLRPGLTAETIDWEGLHLTPRWIGDDSSAAVAAIEPSLARNSGGSDWRRFLAGVQSRDEVALAISMIAHPKDKSVVSFAGIQSGITESVRLPGAEQGFGSVGGARIALANPPALADGLTGADRDLAIRVAGTRELTLDWWSLTLSNAQVFPGAGQPARIVNPGGSLRPLLISGAGEVVAAVWISQNKAIRHYIIPWMPTWAPVLSWLGQQAIPQFVPTAARRIQANLGNDPDLQTTAESAAVSALAELDEDYRDRRRALEQSLRAAQAIADNLRGDLLFGSGAVLEDAVARLLEEVGCTVTSLDGLFGKTVSADLLVDYQGRRRLVEVKSATGNAAENLVSRARKHFDTWPALRPDVDVEGITLVINHQTKIHPGDRPAQAYSRAEFVESLAIPVVTTLALFHACVAATSRRFDRRYSANSRPQRSGRQPSSLRHYSPEPLRRRWWRRP